jgi:phosphoribosylglycinamide formyltransferase-1
MNRGESTRDKSSSSEMTTCKLAVFASGRGTDFQAIVDHEKLGILKGVEVAALISNHFGSMAVQRAKREGIPVIEIEGVTGKSFSSPVEREQARISFDEECIRRLGHLKVDLIALAGFDQLLSNVMLERFPYRILNIHPAYDLVKFGGRNMVGNRVHLAVIKSGVKYSGCTVHFATAIIDLGPPILKQRVPIDAGETPDSLERKILSCEHLLYPKAIQLVVDRRVKIDDSGRRCFVDLFSDNWDIDWSERQQAYVRANPEIKEPL